MTEQKTASADAAKAAAESVIAANSTLATNQEIERAYITMSYRDLLFLNFKEIHPNRSLGEHGNPDSVDLVVGGKNIRTHTYAGDTPRRSVRNSLPDCSYQAEAASHARHQQRPTVSPVHVAKSTAARLRIDDHVEPDRTSVLVEMARRRIVSLLVEGKRLAVMDTMWLWLVGEIHYRDRFRTLSLGWKRHAMDREAKRFLSRSLCFGSELRPTHDGGGNENPCLRELAELVPSSAQGRSLRWSEVGSTLSAGVGCGNRRGAAGRHDRINRALRFSPRRSPSSRSVNLESAVPAHAVHGPSWNQQLIVADGEHRQAGESTNRKRAVPARRARVGAADPGRKRVRAVSRTRVRSA